jgi:two-component system CheB/CheR fusion protein
MITFEKSPRVLVIDDDPDSAFVLAKLLQTLGCEATDCTNPAQSIKLAKRLKPHVVLLDIMMPRMNGFEVARALRELDEPARMIVALTGYCKPDTREQCREAGFDSFILKPVSIEGLHELIEEAHQFVDAERSREYAKSHAG